MKRCPICKTIYPDDANFCPMDASGLDVIDGTPSLDLPTMQAKLVGGRFKLGPQVGGGRTGDRLYVATELVSGVTLEEVVVTGGPLAPDQAARLGVEVGEALAEAAKLGVIHRDVAPKNVVILPDGKVKLGNFSLPVPINDKVFGVAEY